MIGILARGKDNEILAPLSPYQPPEGVKKLSEMIQTDYSVAYDLQQQPFTEFNDLSLIDRADIDQKRWNAYRGPQSEDPDEAWRYNGVKPITRNRILGIVAQMTASIIMPAPFAQNDKDEVDKAAAQVMRDLMEYNVRNSSYVENYIMWITDALVNPAAYLGVGFFEAMQTVKEENEGRVSKKEVVDNVLSGFQTYNIPIDEVLIGNFYQKNLERQRYVIRRRFISYDEAKALKGDHENFKYVQPGARATFNAETDMFYDVVDDTLTTLVEEVTYFNRIEDIEVPYMNGVYLGDADTEANPIKHRTNENYPRYNFGVLGYEDISSRFFYYKSAAWKLGDDDELVIRTEQLLADATFLDTMTPTATTGVGQLSEAIMIPGKNTVFTSPDAKVSPIRLGGSLSSAFQLLLKKEQDMSESTQDPMMAGVQAGSQKTAREAMLLAQNAKIALGRFGNMLANSLKKVGDLMIDVILQHQTVGEISEVSDQESAQKFKTFILSNVPEGSGKVTKKIVFEPSMMGEEMDEATAMERSMQLMEEEGGIDSEMRISKVNPEAWRKMKYYLSVDVQELLPLSLRDSMQAQMAGTPEQAIQTAVPETTKGRV